METMPPFHVVTGQRQLAAIMFTDAVSFSAQMHDQEVATLHRLERDLDVVRRSVKTYGGTVLKTTGDGLLISFGSAVEAVNCALEIQRGFAPRLLPGADGASLRHRIGIHLGDVFMSEGDVMGDGVNIAARIVNEAPVGGIVVSQMVHELVKNKVSLHVVPMGPRRLKNIPDPTVLFRVLLDPPAVAVSARPAAAAPAPAGPERETARPSRMFAAGAVVALLAAGWFIFRAQRTHEEDLAASQRARETLAGLATDPQARTPAEPAAPAVFDFAAAATTVPAERRDPPEPPPRLAEARRLSEGAVAWTRESLRAFTRARPLDVRGLGHRDFAGATVYTDAQGGLFFAEGGASRARSWDELPVAARAALIAATLEDTPLAATAEVRRGAEAFAYLHGQPELAAALRGRR